MDRTGFNRREFLQGAAGAAAAAAAFPVQAFELTSVGVEAPFRVACLSDAHLFDKGRSHRFARSLLRAVEAINALDPQPDFVLFGGDLAKTGRREELAFGREILAELKAPVHAVPGEHDWYLDLGEAWRELFGPDHWSFDHKGVRVVGLNSIHQADFWTERGLDAEQRMAVAAGLDDVRQNPFEVGAPQRAWLRRTLAGLAPETPLLILSHAPLQRIHRAWNFWLEDADAVHRILAPFRDVSVLHGHVHQARRAREGNVRLYGLLSTALAWPSPAAAPEEDDEERIGFGVVALAPERVPKDVWTAWPEGDFAPIS